MPKFVVYWSCINKEVGAQLDHFMNKHWLMQKLHVAKDAGLTQLLHNQSAYLAPASRAVFIELREALSTLSTLLITKTTIYIHNNRNKA